MSPKRRVEMAKIYVVRLSDEERGRLSEMIKKGKTAAYKIKHANMLLKPTRTAPLGRTSG